MRLAYVHCFDYPHDYPLSPLPVFWVVLVFDCLLFPMPQSAKLVCLAHRCLGPCGLALLLVTPLSAALDRVCARCAGLSHRECMADPHFKLHDEALLGAVPPH